MEKKETTQTNTIATNIKILEVCCKKLKNLTANFTPASKHPSPGYSLSMEPDDQRIREIIKRDSITGYAIQAQKTIDLLASQREHLTAVQFHAIQNRLAEITEYTITSRRLDTAVELTKTIASGTFEGPTSANKNRDKLVEKYLVDIYSAYKKERDSYNSSDRRYRHSDADARYRIDKIVEGITKQIKNGEFGKKAQDNKDLSNALDKACPAPVVYDEMCF